MRSHNRGRAVDFTVKGMPAKEVRQWIFANAGKLPYPIRVELGTDGWVHIDVDNFTDGKMKIQTFSA